MEENQGHFCIHCKAREGNFAVPKFWIPFWNCLENRIHLSLRERFHKIRGLNRCFQIAHVLSEASPQQDFGCFYDEQRLIHFFQEFFIRRQFVIMNTLGIFFMLMGLLELMIVVLCWLFNLYIHIHTYIHIHDHQKWSFESILM